MVERARFVGVAPPAPVLERLVHRFEVGGGRGGRRGRRSCHVGSMAQARRRHPGDDRGNEWASSTERSRWSPARRAGSGGPPPAALEEEERPCPWGTAQQSGALGPAWLR